MMLGSLYFQVALALVIAIASTHKKRITRESASGITRSKENFPCIQINLHYPFMSNINKMFSTKHSAI